MVAQQDPSECSQCALCPGSSLDHLGPGSSLDRLSHHVVMPRKLTGLPWPSRGHALKLLGHHMVMTWKLTGPPQPSRSHTLEAPRPSRGHTLEAHWTASAITWSYPGSSLDRLSHHVVIPWKLTGPPQPSRGHTLEAHWTASAITWSCPGSSLDCLSHRVVMVALLNMHRDILAETVAELTLV